MQCNFLCQGLIIFVSFLARTLHLKNVIECIIQFIEKQLVLKFHPFISIIIIIIISNIEYSGKIKIVHFDKIIKKNLYICILV